MYAYWKCNRILQFSFLLFVIRFSASRRFITKSVLKSKSIHLLSDAEPFFMCQPAKAAKNEHLEANAKAGKGNRVRGSHYADANQKNIAIRESRFESLRLFSCRQYKTYTIRKLDE